MIVLLLLLFVVIYAVTIAHLAYGFGKVAGFTADEMQPTTFFSIVVPFRNEAHNLPLLLESLKSLDYPKSLFEFIFIDDFSKDNGQRVIYDWRMQNGSFAFTLLENIEISGSPKKDAISRAVPIAKGSWIITTDADCRVPATWLKTFDSFLQKNDASMLAAPVKYPKASGLLTHFEQLDLLALQGATIGSFGLKLGLMCNGANFAYAKSFFQELGGFSNLPQHAGGDDVLLLQNAMLRFPGKVHYLKAPSGIVETQPCKSWRQLFSQRVRWAAKSGGYESLFAKDLALIVFFGNLALVIATFLTLIGTLQPDVLTVLFAVKFLIDATLLVRSEKFLQTKSLLWMLPCAVLYPFWSVLVAVSVLFGFTWKDRHFIK